MIREDSDRIRALFDEAVQRPGSEREEFVLSLGPDHMVQELRALLAAHDGRGPFDHLMDQVSGPRIDRLLHLEPGDTLGPYRIVREIASGGMAVVYEAFDLRHERDVAVKVLRPALGAFLGADRFVHEMRTTAKLQHPHIIPLFDSGEADGYLFYVMPYVEGESLREKLNRETHLETEEAVRITTEVADALDYAHRHGVIHRDIKPGNILLHEGRPMVADFGIALAMSAAADGSTTEAGWPLGTPDYMSPEQAEAQGDITHRSDIYSLGCLLYEMLAGSPPYTGVTPRSVFEQHASEPVPDIQIVRESVPERVGRAIATALAKVPADRYDTADEFARALRGADAVSEPRFTRRHVRGLTRAAAVVALLLAGLWLTGQFRGAGNRGPGPAAVGMRTRQLTDDGNVIFVAISPDGSRFVRAVYDDNATARIIVRDIEGAQPDRTLALTPLIPMTSLGWVPDGSAVTFFGTHMGTMGQHSVPIDGGPVQTGVASWHHARSPDSEQIALWSPQWKRILVMPAAGWAEGPPVASPVDTIAVSGEYDFIHDVAFSPSGGQLVVSTLGGSNGTLRLIDTADHSQRVLKSDFGPMSHVNWVRDGRALFYTRRIPVGGMQLMRLSFSPDGGQEGEAEPVMGLGDSLWVTHISADARRLVAVKTLVDSRLVRVSEEAGGDSIRLHPIPGGDGALGLAISPDRKWIAFRASAVDEASDGGKASGSGAYDLYRIPADGGTPERVTVSGGVGSFAWSPDGRFFAITAPYEDTLSVWLIPAHGGSPVRLRESHTNGSISWAPGPLLYGLPGNGNFRVVESLQINTPEGIAALTPENLVQEWDSVVDGDRRPLVAAEDGWMFGPHASPDGKWVAISWNRQAGEPGVWRISLSDSTQQLVRPDTRDVRYWPDGWVPDGSAIVAVADGKFVRLPVDGSQPELIFDPPDEPVYHLFCEVFFETLEPDFVCVDFSGGFDALLIEDFDP